MGKGFYLTHEAKSWEQGLPVGNGQQGAVLWAVYSRNGLF